MRELVKDEVIHLWKQGNTEGLIHAGCLSNIKIDVQVIDEPERGDVIVWHVHDKGWEIDEYRACEQFVKLLDLFSDHALLRMLRDQYEQKYTERS